MSPGVAGGRKALDFGAAWVAQAEEAGGLVEGFANGVINGAPKPYEIERSVQLKEGCMSATGNEANCWVGEFVSKRESAGIQVRGDMVIANEWYLEHASNRLGGSEPNQQRSHQPGTDSDGDCLEVLAADGSGRDGLINDWNDSLDMSS